MRVKLKEINNMYLYIAIIILLVGFTIMSLLFATKKHVVTKTVTLIQKEEKEVVNKVKVDIKGNVTNPGVYELEENARVIDAINLAGGLLNDSNTDLINLSLKVKDEMTIIIYSNKEINEYKKNNKEIVYIEVEKCPDKINDACINKETKNDKETIKDVKVSINTASISDLTKISGIGEAKAKDIVSYREEHGEFKSIEEIKNVSGIGDSLFEKIKNNITI